MVKRLSMVVAPLLAAVATLAVVPGTVSAAPGDATTFVFARGADDAVWVRVLDQNTGIWQPWQSLGGAVTGTPYGELMPDGRIAVFGRGVDGGLWTRSTSDLVNWSGWESLGGQMLDDPVVVFTPWITGPGEPDVMVLARGVDFGLWLRSYAGSTGSWSEWRRVSPGPLITPVNASADDVTRSVIVSHVDDNGWLWWGATTRLDASGNFLRGGIFSGTGVTESPVLASRQGAFDGFARLTGNQLGALDAPGWRRLGGGLLDGPRFGPFLGDVATAVVCGLDSATWWCGGSGWSSLGGLVQESPSGDYVDETRFLMTARGLDDGVWMKWWDDSTGTWSGWQGLGGLVRNKPSQLSVFELDDLSLSAVPDPQG